MQETLNSNLMERLSKPEIALEKLFRERKLYQTITRIKAIELLIEKTEVVQTDCYKVSKNSTDR